MMKDIEQSEPLYFYYDRHWYKGGQPNFYDEKDFPVSRILMENYEDIRKEIEDHYSIHPEDFTTNFTPYSYKEEGWKTVNLYSYFVKVPENCRRFPTLDRVARSIPNMCLAQVSVLRPHTRLKAHFGDTNGIARTHLGIRIPGKYPDLGLRIRNETRTWEEGKTFSFSIVNRHLAWNGTDQHRIIVMIDHVLDEYAHMKYWVAALALSAIAMKMVATRFPITRKIPEPLLWPIHRGIGVLVWFRIRLQRHLGI